ncbi:hypothetical protein D3C77_645250 [compost metagenome]
MISLVIGTILESTATIPNASDPPTAIPVNPSAPVLRTAPTAFRNDPLRTEALNCTSVWTNSTPLRSAPLINSNSILSTRFT